MTQLAGGGGGEGGGGGMLFAAVWCNAYENRYVIHTSPQKTLIVITTVTCWGFWLCSLYYLNQISKEFISPMLKGSMEGSGGMILQANPTKILQI